MSMQKYRRIALFLLVMAAGCTGCINFNTVVGSGHVVSTNFDLAGFQSIDASSAFQVEVKSGDHFAVSVSTDDNLLEYLRVWNDGGCLRLGLRPNTGVSSTALKAEVVMPRLTGVTASGATRVHFEPFAMDDFQMDASGASSVDGKIRANNAHIECSGASKVEMSVKAKSAQIGCSGASKVEIFGDASSVDLNGSGASHLWCATFSAKGGG